MAQMLTKDNVREILLENLLSENYYPETEAEAMGTLAYISGVLDMANAVIRKITELGG